MTIALVAKIAKRLARDSGCPDTTRYLHIRAVAATIIFISPLQNRYWMSDQLSVQSISKSLKLVQGQSMCALSRLLKQELRSRLNAENRQEKADIDVLMPCTGQFTSICRFQIEVCLFMAGRRFGQLNNCFGSRLPHKIESNTDNSFLGLWSVDELSSVDVLYLHNSLKSNRSSIFFRDLRSMQLYIQSQPTDYQSKLLPSFSNWRENVTCYGIQSVYQSLHKFHYTNTIEIQRFEQESQNSNKINDFNCHKPKFQLNTYPINFL